MRVKAKHWLNYNGEWHRSGEEFEIPATEADELKGYVDIAETPVFFGMNEEAGESAESVEKSEEAPKRRGRPKKTEE